MAFETEVAGAPRELDFQITGLPANAEFELEILDRDHGHVYWVWDEMGRPEPPTREQTEQLKEHTDRCGNEQFTVDSNGALSIRKTMQPWSVFLLRQR